MCFLLKSLTSSNQATICSGKSGLLPLGGSRLLVQVTATFWPTRKRSGSDCPASTINCCNLKLNSKNNPTNIPWLIVGKRALVRPTLCDDSQFVVPGLESNNAVALGYVCAYYFHKKIKFPQNGHPPARSYFSPPAACPLCLGWAFASSDCEHPEFHPLPHKIDRHFLRTYTTQLHQLYSSGNQFVRITQPYLRKRRLLPQDFALYLHIVCLGSIREYSQAVVSCRSKRRRKTTSMLVSLMHRFWEEEDDEGGGGERIFGVEFKRCILFHAEIKKKTIQLPWLRLSLTRKKLRI